TFGGLIVSIKAVSLAAAGLAVLAATPPAAAQFGRGAPPPCEPSETTICGQRGPEDLVALGSQWVVAGAYTGAGGFELIRIADRRSHTAYPSSEAKHEHDRQTYPDCPGPPEAGRFTTHGVYVTPGDGPEHKLFAVGHGARESIEVFTIDTRPATPVVTWIGCAVAPDPIGLNAVRGLPDGG